MERVELATPEVLFTKYVQSYISKQSEFVVLRNTISKASAFVGVNTTTAYYDQKLNAIIIGNDGKTENLPLKISSFDSLSWGNVSGDSGNIKYIQITMKNDKPVIMLGQIETMELWFDGIRSYQNLPPETDTSKQKISIFSKARTYADKPFPNKMPNIPPPPTNLNFCTKLNIE